MDSLLPASIFFAPGGRLPTRATDGAYGYDLETLKDEVIQPSVPTIIPTGLKLAVDLPHDSEAGIAMLIIPRSSLALKYGLIIANSPGLIDADYTGEIGIIVYNLRTRITHTVPEVFLPAGTRIAQALFVPVLVPRTEHADPRPRLERGGFGSTGD